MTIAPRPSASDACEAGAEIKTSCDYQRLSRNAIETALDHVPGYAAWRRLDPGPQAAVDERYAALPILTKHELREGALDRFVPRNKSLRLGLSSGDIEFAETSGSTDDRVTLVFHAAWWEASERAAWQLNDHASVIATGTHREAVLASPRCVGPGYTIRPLTVTERTIGRNLFLNQKLNPASWEKQDIHRMVEELNRYQPAVLEGDPAYLAPFARLISELGLEIVQPQLIFLTYSYPSRIYLRQIRQVFRAPIASSYGSTETGHVFMECEAGRLHQNIEHCRVDFQPWLSRYGGPLRGRMLVTVFHNPWFAVVRFDIGDVARLDDRGPCPCGRTAGLTLSAIEGRVKDATFTPDGRVITVDDLDVALAGVDGLRGWQLDLPQPGFFRLRIMADPALEYYAGRQSDDVLKLIYGSGINSLVSVEHALLHELSGKFRFARVGFPVDHGVLWKTEP